MKSILIAVALLQGTAAPVAAPLTPSGKWIVDYGESACVLQRDFGSGSARTTVGFKPSPFGDSVEIVTMTAGAKIGYRKSKARLTLQPSGFTVDADAFMYGLKANDTTVTTFTALDAAAATLRTSTGVALLPTAGPSTNITVTDMAKAFGALKTCQADLVKSWGVDPAELDKIAVMAVPASPSPVAWFSNDDYPGDALGNGQQGTSMILWSIDTSGRVTDCKVIKSSGTASLDRASCQAVVRRGRYKPARGNDGKPVLSHAMRRVVWRLP